MGQDTILVRPDTLPLYHEDSLHKPYFEALRRGLSVLCVFYHADEATNDYETRSLAEYLKRLVFTFEALEMKYSYRHEAHSDRWVNILGSGLPTFISVAQASADLENRENRLAKFPDGQMLLQLSLDYMFKTGNEPDAILWQLAELSYLKMLDGKKLFLPFASNCLELEKEDKEARARTYQVAWGCYDVVTNRPLIYFLKFHHDISRKSLEESGEDRSEVLKTIAGCGSRAADIGMIAHSIDETISWVHPKYMKRISLGPFYTKAAFDVSDKESLEKHHHAVYEAFDRYGVEGDYMFFFIHESIFSQRQNIVSDGGLKTSTTREVFWLPEADPETYKRRASVFEPHVLLSHRMLQSLTQDGLADRIPFFRRAKKITYDEGGVIHVFN